MSLRNIEVTAPYMHDGRFRALDEVVDHYDHGLHPSPTLDPALDYTRVSGGLQLSPSDKSALIAFLRTLTDHAMLADTAFADPF
jgi:cytochrome c peroxidase